MIKFYSEYFLSNSEVKKACEIFNISGAITDKYLNNFKIYCLILEDKKEQAQLLFDLSKELDEIDTFFENKFNILMGYASKDEIISDENILYFHLSHKTNNDFNYEPKIDIRNGLKKTIDWITKSENLKMYKSEIYNV